MRSFTKNLSALSSKLENTRKWILVVFIVVMDHLIGAFYSLFFTPNNPIDIVKIPIYEKIFITSIFAPIVETLIFQTALISLMMKFIKNKWLVVLLSAAAFGLSHNYSVAYVSKIFITGVFYGALYVSCKKYSASLYTIAAHSLYNLLGIIMYEIIPHWI